MRFATLILLLLVWTAAAQCPCPCTPIPIPTATASVGLSGAVSEWAIVHPGAPFVGYVGDSIMEGRPNFVGRRSYGGPSGNAECNIANRVYETSGNIVTGMNDGRSGEQVAVIVTIAANYALPPPPKYLIMEGGINDMRWRGTTFASRQSSYDSLKAAADSRGSILIVEEVWPSVITDNIYILAWNSALLSWASANGITVIYTHDWMADPSDHTKLLAAYTVDGTHPTEMGVGRHADAIYNTLSQLEGQ